MGELWTSSVHQSWATPWPLFDAIDKEFGFFGDLAATANNAKKDHYISPRTDSLSVDWVQWSQGDPCWLNPPYGRSIGNWMKKAFVESERGMCIVCLVFVRTDTKWWNEYAMRAAEIRLIPGRITFVGADNGAPAPSCLVVFDPKRRKPHFFTQELPRK